MSDQVKAPVPEVNQHMLGDGLAEENGAQQTPPTPMGLVAAYHGDDCILETHPEFEDFLMRSGLI